ncbi:MAG: hypothetical protein P1V81_06340 [Planctomycetota bacterium]|nr:hypothetical protein [Planctomycetota bacterium]
MGRLLRGSAIGCSVLFLLLFGALIYLGNTGPDVAIYVGADVPKRYLTQLEELGVLEPDETLRYFYSDGLLNIEEGFYFVSDRNLVLYMDAWEEPETIIPLTSIVRLEPSFDDSYLTDSSVTIETDFGLVATFPLSSEGQRDRDFVRAIEEGMAPALGDG